MSREMVRSAIEKWADNPDYEVYADLGALEDRMSALVEQAKADAWAEGVQDTANRNALPEAETAKMLEDNPYRQPPNENQNLR